MFLIIVVLDMQIVHNIYRFKSIFQDICFTKPEFIYILIILHMLIKIKWNIPFPLISGNLFLLLNAKQFGVKFKPYSEYVASYYCAYLSITCGVYF